MTGTWGTLHPMQRAGAVYVSVMLLIVVGGIRADRTPRMVLFANSINIQWDPACGCSTGQLSVPVIGNVGVTAAGGDLLNRDGHLLVLGHLATSHVVVSDRIIELGSVNSDPKRVVSWLRNRQPLAVLVLLLLAMFGWEAISFTAAALATGIGSITAGLALDVLALRLGIGLADPAWIATLLTAGCCGWHAARHFDAVLEGRAQAVVMSLATALLFRDMAGIIGGIAGVALPALSKRVALGFLVAIATSIVLDLPDILLQIAAGSSLAMAVLDRWRAAGNAASRTAAA